MITFFKSRCDPHIESFIMRSTPTPKKILKMKGILSGPWLSICGGLLKCLLVLALTFPLELVRTAFSNVLGSEITEERLENVLDYPTTTVVECHQNGQSDLELVAERDKAKLFVQLWNELSCARECNTGRGNQSPVHGPVFANRLSEWTALVVDGKCRNLLDELEEVNGAVEERWLELALQVDIRFPPADC